MPALELQRASKGFPQDAHDLELIGEILPRTLDPLLAQKAELESRMTGEFDREVSLQIDAVLTAMEERENGGGTRDESAS